jgi:hypothetical protein
VTWVGAGTGYQRVVWHGARGEICAAGAPTLNRGGGGLGNVGGLTSGVHAMVREREGRATP